MNTPQFFKSAADVLVRRKLALFRDNFTTSLWHQMRGLFESSDKKEKKEEEPLAPPKESESEKTVVTLEDQKK